MQEIRVTMLCTSTLVATFGLVNATTAIALPMPHELPREIPRERPRQSVVPEAAKTEVEAGEAQEHEMHPHLHAAHGESAAEACAAFSPLGHRTKRGEWSTTGCPADRGDDDVCPGYVKVGAPVECGFNSPVFRWEAEQSPLETFLAGLFGVGLFGSLVYFSWRDNRRPKDESEA